MVIKAQLDFPPNGTPFKEHLRGAADGDVVGFWNLGGDSRLVVPAPRQSGGLREPPFQHLASFLRTRFRPPK